MLFGTLGDFGQVLGDVGQYHNFALSMAHNIAAIDGDGPAAAMQVTRFRQALEQGA